MSDLEDIQQEAQVREEAEKLEAPPGKEEKRCGDCIFWHPQERECRKDPPVPTVFTTETAFGKQSGVRPEFPTMEENDWCHSFKSLRMVQSEHKYKWQLVGLLEDLREGLYRIEQNTAEKED